MAALINSFNVYYLFEYCNYCIKVCCDDSNPYSMVAVARNHLCVAGKPLEPVCQPV